MTRILRQAVAVILSLSLLPVPLRPLSAADPEPAAAAAAERSSLDKISVADDQIQIQLSRPAKYNTFTTANPPRIVLEILGTSVNLPARVQAGQGANLKRVRAGQFQGEPDPIARVVLDLRKMARYTVTPEGSSLSLKIESAAQAPETARAQAPDPAAAPSAAPVQAAPAEPEPKREREQEKSIVAEDLNTMAVNNSAAAAPAAVPAAPAQDLAAAAAPRDVLATLPKDKVSLDLQDTDVSDVLKLLAAKANINIVYGPDVTGTISLHLNDVPFNEAFGIVLGMKNLMTFQMGGNTIRVITSKQLQKERQDTVGLTRVFPIGYTAAEDMKRQVDAVRSAEKRQGQTFVNAKDNALIVTDTPEGLASTERLIASLDARPKQVLIEAKLVEVNLNKDLELGIQWSYFSKENSNMFGQQGTNFVGGNPTISGGAGLSNPLDKAALTVPGPVPIGSAGQGTGVSLAADKIFGALSWGRVTNNFLLSATLTAAAAKGKVKILSDPKVATLNGKLASVNITTSIPYATTNQSATGAATTTIATITVGVQLAVTPTINADGRISLHVAPTITKPSAIVATGGAAATGAITVDTRNVDTNIMVRDGETIVIGGLITDSISDSEAGIPFFKDIPIIGWLFKKKTQIRARVELLIFVTTKVLQD